MARCVIFCAGDFDGLAEPLTGDDYIIAADGGLRHTRAEGITPHLVLGDFDSLGFVPEGAQLHPVEKDDTDAMLAVKAGLQKGCREFLIYGGLEGPRLAHTLANLQTLQYLADRGARGILVGKTQLVTLVKDGAVRFPQSARGELSVFCQGADAKGVTLTGLKYTLENGCLSCGFPLGVSNQFIGQPSCVQVAQGSLLVIYDRENGVV